MYYSPFNQFQNYSIRQESITRVTGEEGAKAYQMAPNSSAALFDGKAGNERRTTDGASSPAFHYKKLKSSTQTTTDSGRAVSIFSRWPKISTAEESAGGSTPENRHGKNPDGHWSV